MGEPWREPAVEGGDGSRDPLARAAGGCEDITAGPVRGDGGLDAIRSPGRTGPGYSKVVGRPTPDRGTAIMANLDGQVALVTGASRGVGLGVASGLAHAGATVFATGRTIGRAELGAGIKPIPCDHTDDRAVEAAF